RTWIPAACRVLDLTSFVLFTWRSIINKCQPLDLPQGVMLIPSSTQSFEQISCDNRFSPLDRAWLCRKGAEVGKMNENFISGFAPTGGAWHMAQHSIIMLALLALRC